MPDRRAGFAEMAVEGRLGGAEPSLLPPPSIGDSKEGLFIAMLELRRAAALSCALSAVFDDDEFRGIDSALFKRMLVPGTRDVSDTAPKEVLLTESTLAPMSCSSCWMESALSLEKMLLALKRRGAGKGETIISALGEKEEEDDAAERDPLD